MSSRKQTLGGSSSRIGSFFSSSRRKSRSGDADKVAVSGPNGFRRLSGDVEPSAEATPQMTAMLAAAASLGLVPPEPQDEDSSKLSAVKKSQSADNLALAGENAEKAKKPPSKPQQSHSQRLAESDDGFRVTRQSSEDLGARGTMGREGNTGASAIAGMSGLVKHLVEVVATNERRIASLEDFIGQLRDDIEAAEQNLSQGESSTSGEAEKKESGTSTGNEDRGEGPPALPRQDTEEDLSLLVPESPPPDLPSESDDEGHSDDEDKGDGGGGG
jgi:hypothetical protein